MSYTIPFDSMSANGGEGSMSKKEKRSHKVFAEASRAGVGFTARYAYPGSTTEYVETQAGRLVFTDDDAAKLTAADAAELAAFRVMRDAWNRHLDTRAEAKNYYGTKPSPEWLKEVVDDLWLDATSLATLAFTKNERVADWLAGIESAPSWFYWALPLLRREGAIEEAFAAIRPHLAQAPNYREFRNRMSTFNALRDKVAAAIDEQRALADAWESENVGEHRMRSLIDYFDDIASPDSELSLNVRFQRFEEIAGKLGISFDVNEEIAKQNEPYYREITRKRLARMGGRAKDRS